MAQQLLDGREADFFLHQMRTERFSKHSGVVAHPILQKVVVGFEDGIDGLGRQFISEPIAEKSRARKLFAHLPVALQDFFQKGVREEGKPLPDCEPAASFAGDADRILLKIDIPDLNPLYLRSPQTAGGVEAEDAQIPTMNEKAELVRLSVIEQVLVMLCNAAKQPHQLKG